MWLSTKADTAIPYVSKALKVVPLLAPEYGKAAMARVDLSGTVSVGLRAAPHIPNAASTTTKVDNALQFGALDDLTTSFRYITK